MRGVGECRRCSGVGRLTDGVTGTTGSAAALPNRARSKTQRRYLAREEGGRVTQRVIRMRCALLLRSAGPRQARARGTAQHVQLYLASPPPPFGRSRMTVPLVIHARVAFSPDRPPCHPLSLPWPSRRTVKLFSVWGPFESLRGPLNVGVLHGDAHLVHSRPGHVLKRSWSVPPECSPKGQGTSSQTLIKATRTQLHSNAGPAGTWDPSVDADSDLAARSTRSQIATRRSRPLSG